MPGALCPAMTTSTTNSPSTPWRTLIPPSSTNSLSMPTQRKARRIHQADRDRLLPHRSLPAPRERLHWQTGAEGAHAAGTMAEYVDEATSPATRGTIRIKDVLAAEPGPARDAMIEHWCADVWACWQESRTQIVEVARKYLEVA